MKPLVSVIIPNYNYERYLREAIDSALAQTYTNIEIVVVDDGSTDNSRSVIESYGDKIKAIFQQNSGVSAARNNGVKISSGNYIAFLDADDIWLPDKIEKQVELFEREKELGLVHVGVDEFDASGNILKTRLDGMSGDVSHELLLLERTVVLGGGSGFMVSRNVFDEVGGFDLNLMTSADWDIFYRIAKRHKIGFVGEVLLKYRVHGSNMHSNVGRMKREMVYSFEKAFAENTRDVQRLKSRAYGNLHKTLAGSYFQAGEYGNFLKHTFKSVAMSPSNLGYFANFPIRRFKRGNNK